MIVVKGPCTSNPDLSQIYLNYIQRKMANLSGRKYFYLPRMRVGDVFVVQCVCLSVLAFRLNELTLFLVS